MNWFERFLISLQGTMPTPTNYGWFHLMFVALAIISTVLICYFGKNAKDKTFRRIVLISWIIILVLEIYKQLIYSVSEVGGSAVWDYQWYAFPYQLCSTPLYLLPFVAFMKDGKTRDSIMSFLSTFAMFGGLAVFIYPNDVFISTIGINIQTMVHHGLQIVLGIYFMVYVFGVMLGIAMLLNIVLYHTVMVNNGESFNMFYISPYFPCTLPVLSMIYAKVPYVVFLLIYIFGFILAGAIMFALQYYLIKYIHVWIEKSKNKKKEA